jgi:two-component system, OmpR family, sensor histidine kinase MtrB
VTFRPGRIGGSSLRARTAWFFGVGAFSVAALIAVSTYLLAEKFLRDQRATAVQRRAVLDGRLVEARLSGGSTVPQVLADLAPLSTSTVLVHRDGQWFSSSPEVGAAVVPADLMTLAATGTPTVRSVRVGRSEVLMTVVPLRGGVPGDGQLVEVVSLDELRRTMRWLATVLVAGTGLATALGVTVAAWASRRLLEPLNAVADAAAEIAGGELSLRLEPSRDPDLASIAESFNSMVDGLQARIERDARFAADVSHELRNPLTTLVASIDVLQADRPGMTDRQQRAVDLAAAELARFRRMLDELIELARFDAGLNGPDGGGVDLDRLLEQALRSDGRSPELLTGRSRAVVRGDKRRLTRAVLNLLENADRYGGGPVAVTVQARPESVSVLVDDAGPGVPVEDRERIFARFATGRGPASGRGSTAGTGLGLAIVHETVQASGGRVWCAPRPGGGARFVLDLPTASPEDAAG